MQPWQPDSAAGPRTKLDFKTANFKKPRTNCARRRTARSQKAQYKTKLLDLHVKPQADVRKSAPGKIESNDSSWWVPLARAFFPKNPVHSDADVSSPIEYL